MTVTAIPDVAKRRVPTGAPGHDFADLAAHATVSIAVLYWGFVLTHGAGGRDRWVLTVAMVLAVIALLAVRPWRVLAPAQLILGACVAAAPLAVCLIDSTHFFGASQAATYAYSAALFIVVRAYALTAGRRAYILLVVLAAAIAQFAWASIDWVGGGDPTRRMVGTFYWWNPYAAFLLVPAVAGAGLAAIGRGPLRLPGAIAAILCSAGIVLSTSRATLALLLAGWFVALVVAVLSRATAKARIASALRWLVLAGVTVAFTVLVPGPPVFDHRVSPLAGTAARAAGQSVAQNSGYRGVFWEQALKVFTRHPLSGTGFGSFGHQAGLVDPGGAHSTLVHSGPLQALSDGGLLLGLPFLLAGALIAVGLVRRLRPSLWRVDNGFVTLVAAATLLLGIHNTVDFDWTYPSSMAATAIVAAVALAWSPAAIDIAEATGRRRRTGQLACAAIAVCGLVLGQQALHGGWHLSAPSASAGTTATGDHTS